MFPIMGLRASVLQWRKFFSSSLMFCTHRIVSFTRQRAFKPFPLHPFSNRFSSQTSSRKFFFGRWYFLSPRWSWFTSRWIVRVWQRGFVAQCRWTIREWRNSIVCVRSSVVLGRMSVVRLHIPFCLFRKCFVTALHSVMRKLYSINAHKTFFCVCGMFHNHSPPLVISSP